MHESTSFIRTFVVALVLTEELVVAVAGARAADCRITFALDANVTLTALHHTVDYSQAGGSWPIIDYTWGPPSSCASLGGLITLSWTDAPNQTFGVTVQSVETEYLDGPTNFAECGYARPGSAPDVSDFEVTTTLALDTNGDPLSSLPRVFISDITCSGGGTTTTTSIPVETTTTTLASGGSCGDPVGPLLVSGSVPALVNATDALFALRAAVGLETCEICVCDVDASGSVAASDALALLLVAVGQPGDLECPPCN